jgi:hypothetical protein
MVTIIILSTTKSPPIIKLAGTNDKSLRSSTSRSIQEIYISCFLVGATTICGAVTLLSFCGADDSLSQYIYIN